jgi:two-component system NtrC family response regulator
MANILIVDDDEMLGVMLCRHFKYLKHNADFSLTLSEGIQKLQNEPFDIVFLDVHLPDGDGLAALPTIRKSPSQPEVIIITGEGDPDGAELAIKNGAWDYIEKASTISQMTLPLIRALDYRKEKSDQKPPLVLNRDDIIGKSPEIKASLELVAQAANNEVNVLITGKTGTGKEVFARTIHQNSRRSGGNLVVVDCAALPENLVESVLFGHVKGAFTGAFSSQEGLIKQADSGTLFLDEIGELPLKIQKTLLRVLQEHRFRPVGSKQEVQSDFRLIAATNRSLDEMVKKGQFREDLLFRLKSLFIQLPSLTERNGDVNDLIVFYISKFCQKYGFNNKGFTPEFLAILQAYDWPGNVRELINTIEGTINNSQTDYMLYPKHLPVDIRARVARHSINQNLVSGKSVNDSLSVINSMLPDGSIEILPFQDYRARCVDEAEKRYLQNLISVSANNAKKAMHLSSLSRSRLYELLKKHDLTLSS